MCTEILVKRGVEETYCQSVGDLAEALNLHPAKVSPDPEDHCLCNARLNELKARKASEREGWPFPEYIIECEAEEVKGNVQP